jgi:hypothetical protein
MRASDLTDNIDYGRCIQHLPATKGLEDFMEKCYADIVSNIF